MNKASPDQGPDQLGELYDDGPLFHLGFPKCASTFLQHEVFPRLQTWSDVSDAPAGLLGEYSYDRLPPSVIEFFGRKGRYLYSAEGMLNFIASWNAEYADERETSISNFLRIFENSGRCLVAIRRQDSLAKSIHLAGAPEYLFRPESVFVDARPILLDRDRMEAHRRSLLIDSMDYHRWISRIVGKLGPDRVHILVYEDLIHNRQSFLDGLSNAFAEEICLTDEVVSTRHNASNT
jgi:hypothetical protein